MKLKKGTIFLFFFTICQLCICQNKLSSKDGFIFPESESFEGRKPEANWIWDSGDPNPKNYYLHFRKSFTLIGSIKEAKAYISAFSFAELYINGVYIDRVPTNPDPEYQTYEEIDIFQYLKSGKNTIATLVYNVGEGLHHRMNGRGGFFFQSKIIDNEDKIIKLNSDKSWLVAKAIAWNNKTDHRQIDHTIGRQEKYDARLAYDSWELNRFDDSNWVNATEIGVPPIDPWNKIVVINRERTFLKIITPKRKWSRNGFHIYDFGKAITAYPRFVANARESGLKLEIGTAETLGKDSVPLMTDNVNYIDSYITKKGLQSWHPVTWRSFRYLAINQNKDVKIENVLAKFRSFPVKNRGYFSCSDSILNDIWEIGRWSMQICAQDTWMDTPWREQTQYIAGDSRYMVRYSAYSFDTNIKLLNDYSILSGAFSQRFSDKGAIRGRHPTDYRLGPKTSTYIPDYQLEWILMLKEHFMFYKDFELVRQVYPNLKLLLKYFEIYESDERKLLGKVPGWVVLDHPDTFKMDVNGENTAMNCLYFGALNSAAWLARNIIGDQNQAKLWYKKAEEIKQSVQKFMWLKKEKLFKDGFKSSRITQQTQVYALKYGIVEENYKSSLVNFIEAQGKSCEQSFSYWLLNSMFSEGKGQWALDYIRKNWGEQMNRNDFNGAWFENWIPKLGRSKSHAWCSGPTALLPEKVLGIEPILPGWKKFKIKPNLYDLEWCEGLVPSSAGDINVKIKKLRKKSLEVGLQIKAIIPMNTSSRIYVPIQKIKSFVIEINEKEIWKNGQYLQNDSNISFQKKFDDYVVLEFKSGDYTVNALNK
tara:strand:- start:1046 stop:3496 length:2451 start_codon:yes stop_codon:yes gene_type:complete